MPKSSISIHLLALFAGHLFIQSDAAAAVPATNTTANNAIPNDTDMRRVLYGQTAVDDQFPYQAAIFFASTGRHICGAAIISTHRILSAAHCVTSDELIVRSPRIFAITAGTIMRSNLPAQRRRIGRVKHIAVHPQFLRDPPHSDLAVLTLSGDGFALDWPVSERFQHSPRQQQQRPHLAAVPLNGRAHRSARSKELIQQDWHEKLAAHNVNMLTAAEPSRSYCVVSGWGRTHTTEAPMRLQFAAVRLMPNYECVERMGRAGGLIGDDMLCALGGSKEDAASGDSGGPLVCGGELFGIVSFGPRQEQPGVPGIYARVSDALDWIDSDQAYLVGIAALPHKLVAFCWLGTLCTTVLWWFV